MLDISFFASRDNLAVSDLMEMHWGNVAASANWNSRVGDRWRFVTTGAVTNYSTDMSMDIMDTDQRMTEYIRSISLNERVMYEIADEHNVEVGVRSELLSVKSGEMEVNASRQKEIRSGWQNAVWAGYDGSLGEKVSLSLGARLSVFSAMSGDSSMILSRCMKLLLIFQVRPTWILNPVGA